VADERRQRYLVETELRSSFIERAPLFRGVARTECLELARRARDRWALRRQFFFHEGEAAADVWILATGLAKLTQASAEGAQVILRLVGPGEILGGLGLAAGAAQSSTSQALEDCHALALDRATFDEAAARSPVIQRNALRILGERLRLAEDRLRELATDKAPVRVARALLRLAVQVGQPTQGGVVVRLSREDVAQMTGTTLFTVSRLLSGWEEQGLLRGGRERIVVADAGGLSRLVAGPGPTPD
jgi:CRP-like cAMP-binding protein